ncbi:MAG: hypothetical protein HQK77_04775 [Desulfobacterales bacterium]|nr:hypothetical protein [Desulfobacterales bacterium]
MEKMDCISFIGDITTREKNKFIKERMEKFSGLFVAFPIPEEIRNQARHAVEKVRNNPDAKGNAHLICQSIISITNHGLDYIYIYPLELANVGMLGKNTIRIGVNTAKKGITIAVNQIIGAMHGEKLSIMADFLESIIHEFSS